MTLEAGDVVLLPFPHTNLASAKQRPALILTDAAYNASGPDAIVAYVTAQPQDGPWTVPLSIGHLVEGDLPKPSWIRADRLATLDQGLVRKVAAKVRPERLEAVRSRIRDPVAEP